MSEAVKKEEVKKEEPKTDSLSSSALVDKVYSPIKGNIIKLESVKDEAFSSGAMGKGIAIEPKKVKYMLLLTV